MSVLQGNDQPVPVPCPRPVAVELRRVHVDLARQSGPRLVVGEEVAAFAQEHLVEQRLDLGNGHGLASLHLVEPPAGGGLWDDGAGLRVDKSRADVEEVEGVADAGAHTAQDLGARRLTRDPRRHGEQLLERALMPCRLRRFARRLDGERRVVDERDEHLQIVVRGPEAAERLVHREDPEKESLLVPHRDEESVLGVPGVGVARPAALRHIARPERVPVDGSARHDVGVAEQNLLRLLVPVHGRYLEVVPLRPVEVDGHGSVAERLADGAGDCVEQRGKILTRPQETGNLDEAPQR